jgi:hypothetical protein
VNRRWFLIAGALGAAGVAVLLSQAVQTPRPLSDLIPSSPLLYIEAKDFGGLVREWNTSRVKAAWLGSANYKVFRTTRLFLRLNEAQQEFSNAAGLPADMTLVDAVAGGDSALALYDIGGLEFLHITRMPQARALQTILWQSRAKFQPRRSAGIDYYVRQQQQRTAAFAVTNDLLLVATNEQSLASALALIAGQSAPAMRQEPWYRNAAAAQPQRGDLRMVQNFARVARSPYFQSYWVQENVRDLRQFDSFIADLDRTAGEYRERRSLLRPEAAADMRPAEPAVGELARLAPPDAGLFRAWAKPDPAAALAFIAEKMIAPRTGAPQDNRLAPPAVDMHATVGTEADLETRIDEAPLEDDSGRADLAPLRHVLESNTLQAMLEVQSARDETFVTTVGAVALSGDRPWDGDAVRNAISAAATKLWTVSGLGAGWVQRPNGVWTLTGLGRIAVAVKEGVLIVGTSEEMVQTMAGRTSAAAAPPATYAARYLHAQELPKFERMMRLIDSGSQRGNEPQFFSENIASLGGALGRVDTVTIESHDDGRMVKQTVAYRLR